MKKIFTLIIPLAVVTLAIVAVSPATTLAQATDVVCPAGYTCTPIQPEPVTCPVGYVCTPIVNGDNSKNGTVGRLPNIPSTNSITNSTGGKSQDMTPLPNIPSPNPVTTNNQVCKSTYVCLNGQTLALSSLNPSAGLPQATDATLSSFQQLQNTTGEDHTGPWSYKPDGQPDLKWQVTMTNTVTKTIKAVMFSTGFSGLAGFTSSQYVDGKQLYPPVLFYNSQQLQNDYDQPLGTYNPGTYTFQIYGVGPMNPIYTSFTVTFYFTDGTYASATGPALQTGNQIPTNQNCTNGMVWNGYSCVVNQIYQQPTNPVIPQQTLPTALSLSIVTRVGGNTIDVSQNGSCVSNMTNTYGNSNGSCVRTFSNLSSGNYSVQWLGGYPIGSDGMTPPTVTPSQSLVMGRSLVFYLDFTAATNQKGPVQKLPAVPVSSNGQSLNTSAQTDLTASIWNAIRVWKANNPQDNQQ